MSRRSADDPAAAMRQESPQAIADLLSGERYLADEGLATAVYLALELPVPLLLEGEPGVGNTEVAKALDGRFYVRSPGLLKTKQSDRSDSGRL